LVRNDAWVQLSRENGRLASRRPKRAIAALARAAEPHHDKFLSHPFPGTSGGVPDVEDFNGVPCNAVEYFILVAPNHLHAHIWIIRSL